LVRNFKSILFRTAAVA